MFKRALFVVVLSLIMVSMAHANAIITLTSLTPENSVGGYLPGTVVDFQVSISQNTDSDILLRGAQLDFAASDSGLTFLGDFNFDFTSLVLPELADSFYFTYPVYPQPATAYVYLVPNSDFMLELPASGSLTLGTGQLALPTTQGTYLLDALNAGASAIYSDGAQIYFGFGDLAWLWWSGDDTITGDPLALNVVLNSPDPDPDPDPVPEPATMLLLGFGIIGLAGFRRKL